MVLFLIFKDPQHCKLHQEQRMMKYCARNEETYRLFLSRLESESLSWTDLHHKNDDNVELLEITSTL